MLGDEMPFEVGLLSEPLSTVAALKHALFAALIHLVSSEVAPMFIQSAAVATGMGSVSAQTSTGTRSLLPQRETCTKYKRSSGLPTESGSTVGISLHALLRT